MAFCKITLSKETFGEMMSTLMAFSKKASTKTTFGTITINLMTFSIIVVSKAAISTMTITLMAYRKILLGDIRYNDNCLNGIHYVIMYNDKQWHTTKWC